MHHGLTPAEHPTARTLVQQTLDAVNARYAKVAQVKRFAIPGHDLPVETGELTPTRQAKRRVIEERCAAVLDGHYA